MLHKAAIAPSVFALASLARDGIVREFDLGLDFSFSSNPNGAWRYGYSRGTTLALDQFLVDTYSIDDDAAVEGFWHPNDAGGGRSPSSNPSDGGGGYYPYIGENPGPVPVVYQNAWALRAHEVAMEASVELFASAIDGYGGDPSFHPVQGKSPALDYQANVTLQTNDVLTFAVGYGPDKTNYNDTTGLYVHLVLMPN
jgi:hypothetical protein